MQSSPSRSRCRFYYFPFSLSQLRIARLDYALFKACELRAEGTASAVYLVAGTGPHLLPVRGNATDYTSFNAALVSRGFSATATDVGSFAFQGPRKLVALSGERVEVWPYANPNLAFDDASQVSMDGSSVCQGARPYQTCLSIDFVDYPHWYLSGSIIALYVGHNTTIISALDAIFGPQLAGS